VLSTAGLWSADRRLVGRHISLRSAARGPGEDSPPRAGRRPQRLRRLPAQPVELDRSEWVPVSQLPDYVIRAYDARLASYSPGRPLGGRMHICRCIPSSTPAGGPPRATARQGGRSGWLPRGSGPPACPLPHQAGRPGQQHMAPESSRLEPRRAVTWALDRSRSQWLPFRQVCCRVVRVAGPLVISGIVARCWRFAEVEAA
jgi:hypothetical protein